MVQWLLRFLFYIGKRASPTEKQAPGQELPGPPLEAPEPKKPLGGLQTEWGWGWVVAKMAKP